VRDDPRIILDTTWEPQSVELSLDDRQQRILVMLLDAGADVDAHSAGRSLLETAIDSDFSTAVTMLCARGADLGGLSGGGSEPPLSRAVRQGRLGCVHALLEAGAPIGGRCGPDWDAVLEISDRSGDPLVANLLRTSAATTI